MKRWETTHSVSASYGNFKTFFLFVFQYSQGIFGFAITKKKNTYRGKWESNSVVRDRYSNRCNFKFVLFWFGEQKLMCVTRQIT